VADSEYYRELDPPVASIPLEINLNDIDLSDTIYIMDVTRLILKVNTYGKTLRNVQYLLENNSIGSGSEVIINPNDIDDGKYKLTVEVTVSSGTGSLADMMGMEGYQGEISWNIRIMKNFDPGLKLGFRKNADNLLEFYWETSTYIPKSIFEKYEVRGETTINITDQDRKNVTFEDYVFGWMAGSVDLFIKCTGGYSRYYHKALSFESHVPKLYFENLGVKRLRVYWDKPFLDARYEIISEINNTQIPVVSTLDTSVVVSAPSFAETRGYRVKMYPKNSTNTATDNYISGGYRTGNRGLMALDLDYYGVRNCLIAIDMYGGEGIISTFDLQTFVQTPLINQLKISNPQISCVQSSDKIALNLSDGYFIYNDDSFINPVIIHRTDNSYGNTDIFKLTSDDRLFVVKYYASVCDVYNANTGLSLFTFDIVERPASRNVSADGKYFCCASANGLTIYLVGASGIENMITLPGNYTNALFNPANPQQLIVKQDNDIKVLEAPDFQSIYTHTATYSTLLDIDPANGNILYHQRYIQQDSLHVIRTTPVVEAVFSIATSISNNVKLKGNLLIEHIHHNYFLDITPYLKP